ncbi:MAG: GH3 family domain-containing protein [Cyclonatronaceae bacterium]
MSPIINVQKRILRRFLKYASHTAFGKNHDFRNIKSYEDYARKVPLTTADDYIPYVEQAKRGEADTTWPGSCKRFALSAGTTGAPKTFTLTKDRIKSDRVFLRRVVLAYLKQFPQNTLQVFGPQLSFPGNVNGDPNYPGATFGEVSGHLALTAPGLLSNLQLIPAADGVSMDFGRKLEVALEKGLKSDLRVITALPSLMVRFFQLALERTGKQRIADIWPNLCLLISGGEPLPKFRAHLEQLCEGQQQLHFIENYGSSEGYFAFNADQSRDDLKLIVDNNVFYEWIPNPSRNTTELLNQPVIPSWEVEAGVEYGMVVTTNSGIWRYVLNDVITFTDLKQPRIKVIGRISDVLDDYGEAVEASHTDEVLRQVTRQTGGVSSSCTVGVHKNPDDGSVRHVWFIEWAGGEKPADMQAFAQKIDQALRNYNRSYRIRRDSETLQMPLFYELNSEAIEAWKQEHTKGSAQTKFPRMISDHDRTKSLMKRCEPAPAE